MAPNFIKQFYIAFFISIAISVLPFCMFTPTFMSMENISLSDFIWPTPGYTTITSGFGYRTAPTAGSSTYHSGIDIGAPFGANIVSIFSGTVTYTGFSGPGGFTITIKNGNYIASYCHVSPIFLVRTRTVCKSRKYYWISRSKKCIWCS